MRIPLKSDCIIEEETQQSVKLLNQDAGLTRLEEAAVDQLEFEKRMSTLRGNSWTFLSHT